MARTTYGQSMSDWEHRQDETYWRRRFERAQAIGNYTEIEELLQEALCDNYEIPNISDPNTLEILKKLKKA